jgi:hypothetical protein
MNNPSFEECVQTENKFLAAVEQCPGITAPRLVRIVNCKPENVSEGIKKALKERLIFKNGKTGRRYFRTEAARSEYVQRRLSRRFCKRVRELLGGARTPEYQTVFLGFPGMTTSWDIEKWTPAQIEWMQKWFARAFVIPVERLNGLRTDESDFKSNQEFLKCATECLASKRVRFGFLAAGLITLVGVARYIQKLEAQIKARERMSSDAHAAEVARELACMALVTGMEEKHVEHVMVLAQRYLLMTRPKTPVS